MRAVRRAGESGAVKSTLLARLMLAALAATSLALGGPGAAAAAQDAPVRVTGVVRDDRNSVTLPGVAVEAPALHEVTYTDVDGRFTLRLPAGEHELKVWMDGYQPKLVKVTASDAGPISVDVGLTMSSFAETVTVTGQSVDADSSGAEAQMLARRNAPVITDNLGAQDMRQNGDTDAAAALQRVTGLSVVDNSYVFVRGLGERYSNTTLGGASLPSTEPDKKVVPLDLFPSALIDSVQIAKSYSADKPADFAGGLVQIVPLKIANRPVLDLAYGTKWIGNATGEPVLLSPLGGRDWLGYDNGMRSLPDGFPDGKIVRQGVYTPDVGFTRDQITSYGRLLENRWTPARDEGRPGQNWSAAFGNRFGRFGLLASVRHSYEEGYTEENRKFFRIGEDALEEVTDYDFQTGVQKAQLGAVVNMAYQFTPNNRVAVENFYTHTGRDEGRFFEGPNTENNFWYRNSRVQFIEEGLLSSAVSGDHYLQGFNNSRLDWRITTGRATRDEPDLRETLYQGPLSGTGPYLLADESQSGFRMFNAQEDDTLDVQANWSLLSNVGGRPVQWKFGPSYTRRTRDFSSRRFRYIPTNASGAPALTQAPEVLFASGNIGSFYRFNEETRPVDAYDAELENMAVYGQADAALGSRARLVAGLRVERFEELVNTFDPFGLFLQRTTAKLDDTDVFPALNFVYSVGSNQNLRLGFSQTANRPEFRELAAFEFTDVVGNRAIRGNPNLTRALIQNFDARWELFDGGRDILAASAFYKSFDDPIERVISAGAQPLASFQNADSARNFGVEVEAAKALGRHVFVNANYTFVDSTVTLAPEARSVQTSQSRALAGQSNHLLNLIGETTFGAFQARILVNYFGDRISDVGANGAPDIVEEGRETVDVVLIQRFNRLAVRLTFENLTDPDFLWTQSLGSTAEAQRLFKLGRTVGVSFGYSFF
jgi:outer membrane receptor protein involved in Fe transport